MTLLQEIIEGAADPAIPIGAFLRKCKNLAYSLSNEPFKAWVERELQGYPPEAELPDYRAGLRGQAFVGPSLMPSVVDLHDLDLIPVRQSVCEIEALVRDSKAKGENFVQVAFPQNIILAGIVRPIWIKVPTYAYEGVLDKARDVAHTFALEIRTVDPHAGEAVDGDATTISNERITQIFNTTITASNLSLAQGSTGVEQTIGFAPGDLSGLLSRLEQLGVAAPERDALADAIAADEASGEDKGRGPRVKAWLGGVLLTTATSAGRVGETASGHLLAMAIGHYYGLG